MKIKLAADLEKALLRSIATGVCKPDIVEAEELSKTGRQAYESIVHLLKKSEPPLKPDSVLLTAQSLFGVDRDDFRDYLKSFKELEVGAEVAEIARTAREKALLVRLINEAGTQLSQGHLDPAELARLMESNNGTASALEPLSLQLPDEFTEPPHGVGIRSLSVLSKAARGLIGVWIVGGEPGLGKSTLAFQIAIDAGREIPAIYYDLDGTGYEWLRYRVRCIAGGDVKACRRLTERLYLRESIHNLDDDIAGVRKHNGDSPILIVIDSLQTLPTNMKYKKEHLDSWINRFKQLTKKNIIVLAVSEQNRANYGEPRMAGYKGSGDIEYAGSLCIQLLKDEDAGENDPVELHIVKNRHGTRKGHIADLMRDKKKEFWFTEEEA